MSLHAIFCFAAAAVALALGTAAAVLDRRSAVWRLFLAGMLLLAAEIALAGMAGISLLPEDALHWQKARLAVSSLLPATWLLFSLLHARGSRMEIIRRWSPVLALFAAAPLAAAAGWNCTLVGEVLVYGPPDRGWMTQLSASGKALHVILLLGSVLVLMNLERTFRSAVGTMRWRIKFMILGTGTVFAVRFHTSAQALLYSASYPDADILNASAVILGGLLMARGLARARTDRMDLYVSHTVLYHSAAILMSGLYLLALGIMAGLFHRLGAATHFPALSLLLFAGIIGLGVILVSDRLRLFTKRFVSLHLRRPQYDYRQVWLRFSEATAGLMERKDYCRSVVRMVSETFEALSVSIWLARPERNHLALGASTSQADDCTLAEIPSFGDAAAAWIEQARRGARQPVNIEEAPETWAATLREANPTSFPGRGGRRIAMPLVGQDKLTGIMVIGDRVGGAPFTPEELVLIGVIGGQIGAGLLNADLSERLLQAREMEAFQTMSAFFVHDLKNTASTLSLMLDNLPRHFADPSFRDDALKAIAKCVGRIENLIRRLSALRHKLDVHPEAADLNALVRSTIKGMADTLGPAPVLDLGSVPVIHLDAEQVEKVLTNLLLNAADATGRQGEIRVSTRFGKHHAVLTVADNGPGMSRRFIEESLFRPFCSTKKDGLGIGLFQSRMIVEAHGGKMDVESEEGRGCAFRVRLPANREDR